ncbi:Butirosin biosynthesis, BtrG-like protein [Umbelopsis sp. PMI_123]|nr:Butirosin biosynthesis, BtrG-like protein [Umbelopsis sp. PMI_123]
MSAFFYGTLQSNTVLLRVLCGPEATEETVASKLSTLKLRPAVLKGYRRHALKNLDYPGVVKSESAENSVIGLLCEGLSRQDILRLDAFEGDEYERVTVSVSTLGTAAYPEVENNIPTQLYLWTAGNEHLEDREWELEKFIQGTQVAWMSDRCEFKMVDQLGITTQV